MAAAAVMVVEGRLRRGDRDFFFLSTQKTQERTDRRRHTAHRSGRARLIAAHRVCAEDLPVQKTMDVTFSNLPSLIGTSTRSAPPRASSAAVISAGFVFPIPKGKHANTQIFRRDMPVVCVC